jgi:hypothetical protein
MVLPNKIGVGKKITAHRLNSMLDGIRQNKNALTGIGGSKNKSFVSGESAICVKVVNKTGSDLNARSVIGLGDQAYIEDDNDILFNRVLRAEFPSDAYKGRWAVLESDLPANAIGNAFIAGAFAVKLYVENDDHEYAELMTGETICLTTSDSGVAQILWKESSSGTCWGIVRLGGQSSEYILYEATTDSEGGTIQAKRVDVNGDVVGEPVTLTVLET